MKKKTGEKFLVSSITEWGSNYIRFDNGTQMCYDRVNYTGYDTIVEYPIAFAENTVPFLIMTPTLNGMIRDHYPLFQSYATTSEENTNTQFKVESTELKIEGSSISIVPAPTNYITIYYIAIGKWK